MKILDAIRQFTRFGVIGQPMFGPVPGAQIDDTQREFDTDIAYCRDLVDAIFAELAL